MSERKKPREMRKEKERRDTTGSEAQALHAAAGNIHVCRNRQRHVQKRGFGYVEREPCTRLVIPEGAISGASFSSPPCVVAPKRDVLLANVRRS